MTDAETLENILKVKSIFFDIQNFSDLVIDNQNLWKVHILSFVVIKYLPNLFLIYFLFKIFLFNLRTCIAFHLSSLFVVCGLQRLKHFWYKSISENPRNVLIQSRDICHLFFLPTRPELRDTSSFLWLNLINKVKMSKYNSNYLSLGSFQSQKWLHNYQCLFFRHTEAKPPASQNQSFNLHHHLLFKDFQLDYNLFKINSTILSGLYSHKMLNQIASLLYLMISFILC